MGTPTRTGLVRSTCRGCGRTEDVGHLVDDTPCAAPVTTAGFTIDEAEVVFWGHCPDCRART